MGDRFREHDRGRRPPWDAGSRAKPAPRSRSSSVTSQRKGADVPDSTQRRTMGAQAASNGAPKRRAVPKTAASAVRDAGSFILHDSFDMRMGLHTGYPTAVHSSDAGDELISTSVLAAPGPLSDFSQAAVTAPAHRDDMTAAATPGTATLTIQRWWRRREERHCATHPGEFLASRAAADDRNAASSGTFNLTASMDHRQTLGSSLHLSSGSEFSPGGTGIHSNGRCVEAPISANRDQRESNADCHHETAVWQYPEPAADDLRPQMHRPYCPSRYEDPAPASGSVDRVSQLRSRIRSLNQDLRGHAEGEVSSQPTAQAAGQELLAGSRAPSAAASSQPPPIPLSSLPLSRPSSLPLSRPDTPLRLAEPHDKLSSILSFLDEVEESSRADMCSLVSSARSSRVALDSEVGSETGGGGGGAGRSGHPPLAMPLGLAENAFAVQSRASLLEVEVNDKKHIIATLKQAIAEAKERERNAVQEVTREWEEKTQKQKAHYEAGLERQLQLVDRLLNDKTELTKRCELFSEELKAVERKFQMKTEDMDEQSSKNLARQKQNWMAAEKLRREAWEKDKTRDIKEITIKGLQPEVERILSERKQEKIKLDERHREQMDTQRRELLELAQNQVREAREALVKEHEHHLDQEREAHRRKNREEFDKFSGQLQDERTKCAADLLAERRKHEQGLQQEAENFDSRLREAVSAERIKADAAIEGSKVSASDSENRHRTELTQLQERLRTEKEQWQQEHAERTQLDAERRETNLREDLTKERDRQLEVLVDRLGREHVEQQRAIKKENTSLVDQIKAEGAEQVQRVREQLDEARAQSGGVETDRALLQQTLQTLETRLEAEGKRAADMETRICSLEGENAVLQKNAEKSLEVHREELWQLTQANDRDAEASRQEMSKLNARILEERARAEELQKDAKRREDKIISDLEARVKRTLQSKDDTIGELRTRCAASDNKLREFEYLLARQREELLSGITKDILS